MTFFEWAMKSIFPNFCWHDWRIIYTSPSGVFVQIKCSKCGEERYEGL